MIALALRNAHMNMNTSLNADADAGVGVGVGVGVGAGADLGEATTVVDIPIVLTPPIRAHVPDPSPGLALDPDPDHPPVQGTACAPVRGRGTEIETMGTTARPTGKLVSAPVPVPAPSVHLLALAFQWVLALAMAYSAFSTEASAVVPVAALGGVAPRVDTRLASLTIRANVGGVSVNIGTTSVSGRCPVVLLVLVLDTGSWVKC
jgi:hypothetical protein